MLERSRTLVTGASGGIGEAIARELAARGSHLVVTARREDRLHALAAELSRRHGVRVDVAPADLAAPGGPDALVQALGARDLSIDHAILNAGAGVYGPLAEAAPGSQTAMVRLNCEAIVALAHALVPAMVARRRGGLLLVASTASFQPAPHYAVYAASKAFVKSFGVALAEELRASGVTVSVLCPGPVATEFHARAGIGAELPATLRPLALPANEVARAALDGFERGETIVVPGVGNQLQRGIAALTPDTLAAALAGRVLRRARRV